MLVRRIKVWIKLHNGKPRGPRTRKSKGQMTPWSPWLAGPLYTQECKDPRRQCFVTRDVDLWPFDLKQVFPQIIMGHLYVKNLHRFLSYCAKKIDKRRWQPYSRECRRRG